MLIDAAPAGAVGFRAKETIYAAGEAVLRVTAALWEEER